MNIRILIAAVAATFVSSLALAQYVGPSAVAPYRSVAAVLDNAPDDADVELEGFIVQRLGKEKYLFSDGQRQIRIEIESEDFPTTPVGDKTRVRIRGEVEKDFMQTPEIDVASLTIL